MAANGMEIIMGNVISANIILKNSKVVFYSN